MTTTPVSGPSNREWLGLFIGTLVAALVIATVASSVGSFYIVRKNAQARDLANKVTIAAAACADQPGTQSSKEVDRCVVLVLGFDYRGEP